MERFPTPLLPPHRMLPKEFPFSSVFPMLKVKLTEEPTSVLVRGRFCPLGGKVEASSS